VKYFAYGSNMSLARLRHRVPGAVALGCHSLPKHQLRFHKAGQDGSGKCDAYYTGDAADVIYGALFDICQTQKQALDNAEGLGMGYDIKGVTVIAGDGIAVACYTYVATHIESALMPYSWYLDHVLIGARETGLPSRYIEAHIQTVQARKDSDQRRDEEERAIHGKLPSAVS
jgi:hypothetical protein